MATIGEMEQEFKKETAILIKELPRMIETTGAQLIALPLAIGILIRELKDHDPGNFYGLKTNVKKLVTTMEWSLSEMKSNLEKMV